MRHTIVSLLVLVLSLTAVSAIVDEVNVIKVKNYEEFTQLYLKQDFLTGFFFYRSSADHAQIVEYLVNELGLANKNLFKVVAVDCETLVGGDALPICSEEHKDNLPQILFLEPPATLINPYTKQPMQPIEHRYQGDGTPAAVGSFAKKKMPSFSTKISSKPELDKFLQSDLIENKVILFTNKKETPLLYRALTSEYRDRLEFADVNESVEEVIKEYNIEKFPTLIALVKNDDGTYEREEYESDMKIEKLLRFLKRYALKEKVERPIPEAEAKTEKVKKEDKKKEKVVPKPNPVTPENFEQVYNNEKLAIVHVFKGEEQHPAMNETFKKFNSLVDFYELNCTEPAAETFCTTTLGAKSLPIFRVLPIGNEEKKRKSKATLSKSIDLEDISKEISDLTEDLTTSLNPQSLSTFLSGSVTAKRPALVMFHNQDELPLTFRTVTQLEKYKNKINFANFKNAPEQVTAQFNIKSLPALVVIFLRDPDSEIELQQNMQVAQYTGRYVFNELTNFVDVFLPAEERETVKPQEVVEITSTADFEKHCVQKGLVCAIALLNGNKDNEEAAAKLKENIQVLEKAQIRFSRQMMSFMWIDTVCHSELMVDLDLQMEMVPTLITYNPTKQTFSQLIGVLNRESLVFYLDQVLKNKVSPYPVNKPIALEEKDCVATHKRIQELEAQSETKTSDEDDEILREILEEERKKQEEREKELAEEKDKKKNKKKKGKKGKKAQKDEL